MTHEHHTAHHHGHGEVHLTEDDWQRMADHATREGELFLGFVTEATRWVGELRCDAPPVDRVIDVGSGPGVGTCEWAERFPVAEVVAADGSPAMLQRAADRTRFRGLADRVTTELAELPGGLAPFAGTADVVWASMALHHMGDEVEALREMASCLRPGGLLVIAEFGDPLQLVPMTLDLGRPGLPERLQAASASWFAAMRAGLDGSVPSRSVEEMMVDAGLTVVGSRLSRRRFDAPISDAARTVAVEALQRMRDQLAERLDPDDVATLDVLLDAPDPRSFARRPDAFIETSRRLVVARP